MSVRLSHGSEIWEKDTKSHQDRRIVLDAQTVELLAEHWERCTKRTKDIGIDPPKDAYVFSNEPDGSTPLKPSSVTQRYRRLVQALGIETHLHALRHYSATELIAAGVDIRTVAGRLRHGSGGSTTLRVYAAWLSEADQRASSALLGRLPAFPERVDSPQERAKVYPRAPFELIASQIRQEILSGHRRPGEAAPTVNELRQQHDVSAGTAHRALGLLKEWRASNFPEFREQTAKLIVESGRSIASVAAEYGIGETTVGNWVKKYREAHPQDEEPLELSERARLVELERENRELAMENAFLKKAAAYFAREQR